MKDDKLPPEFEEWKKLKNEHPEIQSWLCYMAEGLYKFMLGNRAEQSSNPSLSEKDGK